MSEAERLELKRSINVLFEYPLGLRSKDELRIATQNLQTIIDRSNHWLED